MRDGFAEILPTDSRFRVLITTRLRNLDINIEEISLNVLSPEEALQLLINIIGEKRVNKPSRHCEEERRSNRISLVMKLLRLLRSSLRTLQ